MSNDKKDNPIYEPNFIMMDTDPAGSEGSSSAEHETPADGSSPCTGQDRDRGSEQSPPPYTGGVYDDHDYDEEYTAPQNGDSASWDNQNGLGRIRRAGRRKRSPKPVTLTRKSLAALIICSVLLSALCGAGGVFAGKMIFSGGGVQDSEGSVDRSGYTLEDATGSNMSIQEITEASKSSVVEIKTESVASDSWMQQYVTQGAGSGVIITENGYIVTNNHVIDGAGRISVTTADQQEYEAELVGTDPITDIAVIRIKAGSLTPATYGNSDQLAVGDMAVAIGNPLGELGGTVTAGIISALDRELAIDGKSMTLLQTDSSINPGNSGGGLFNSDGQLIGIVVAKSSGSDVEGLGFAIPVNTAADIAQQLMTQGYVSGQPSTGMSYTEESGRDSIDRLLNNGQNSRSVYIVSVEGENAKKAGFEKGDMVYAVDGTEIQSFNELSTIVTSHKVGDKLRYTVIRDGHKKNIPLVLEEKKAY